MIKKFDKDMNTQFTRYHKNHNLLSEQKKNIFQFYTIRHTLYTTISVSLKGWNVPNVRQPCINHPIFAYKILGTKQNVTHFNYEK